jgi:hypothetical protein
MQKKLEQIIKDYNLEGTRIKSGRQRIYPQRKGLNATPEQLENLKSVLDGNSVKGTLRITAGDVVIAANTAGAIEKAFDPGLLPNQPKSSEVDLMQTNTEVPVMESQTEIPMGKSETSVSLAESKAEVPTIETTSEAQVQDVLSQDTLSQPVEAPSVNPLSSASTEKLETVESKLEPTIAQTDSKTPQQTYLDLLKQSPAFEGVDVTYEDLQALSLEAMKPLDAIVLKAASQNNLSRDEAESIIGAGSPYIQASVDKIQASAEQLVTPEFVSASEQTQAENEAARETYLDLLKQHPEFPDKDITLAQLSQQSLVDGMFSDTYVVGMAYEKGLSREELDRVITQGSPYVQQQIETGSRTNARNYITQISSGYQDKLQGRLENPTLQAQSVDPTAPEAVPTPPSNPDSVQTEPSIEQAPNAVQTAAEKKTALLRETYFELLQEHPDFKDLVGVATRDELLEQPASIQQIGDRQVSEMAIERGVAEDDLKWVIDRGSPYVQQQREAGALSTVQRYQTDLWFENRYRFDHQTNAPQRESYVALSDAFYDSEYPGDDYADLYARAQNNPAAGIKNDTQVVLAAFRLNESPAQLEGALSESPYVQAQLKQGVPLAEMQQKYIAPIMAQYTEFYHEKISKGSPEENLRTAVENVSTQHEQVKSTAAASTEAKEFDHPETAQTLDPTKDFRDTVQRGAATLQTHTISAKETLELAQKNLSTFAKHVKHRGLKAWAKEQMPILQNKTKELVQAQAAKIGEYAKEQAPIIKDAAITGAKQVSKTVVDYAKENAPVVAEKAKALGGTIVERVYSATRLVDPTRVEALGARVLGQDGGFEGNTFHFKRTDSGIEISLKNGTPVYANGKLNPKLDGSSIYQLNQLAQKVDEFKTPTQVEEKRKAISR